MSEQEYTTSSGNHCILRTITIGDRSVCDVTWDADASDLDIRECSEWFAQKLGDETGAKVFTTSIRESDPDKISKLFQSHLGGGEG